MTNYFNNFITSVSLQPSDVEQIMKIYLFYCMAWLNYK